MVFTRGAVLMLFVSVTSTARVLEWPPLHCPRQDLKCTVKETNCWDSSWQDMNTYTPSGPEELQASVSFRRDEAGNLHPVLKAQWKIKDDGSIRFLNATVLHVMVMSTNQNLCVQYTFREVLTMRSPSGEKWSFLADMVVLEPGRRYLVSVVNIPKPEQDHSTYDVSKEITVPGCQNETMQTTQFCLESGSVWESDIRVTEVTGPGGGAALAVSFHPGVRSLKYMVVVKCSVQQHAVRVYKGNHITVNVTFSLDKWPRSCCQFDVKVQPFFPQCGAECVRQSVTHNICHAVNPEPDAPDPSFHVFVILGVVLTCVAMSIIAWILCKKTGGTKDVVAPMKDYKLSQPRLKEPPKILVIYSQDHHLYKQVVLQLCAFLQAKCGTTVLVDLLDSTSVGLVGRVRWLEWQRQQLKNPSDKILVLCSKGVQAKWRALCGEGRVMLREDLLSPTDDMLTPFLHLFLPDMHQAGMLGKYMVAFFDEICGEEDIPSVFDITSKYKLMKHFEELFFRIIDVEKYQPHQVNHIEGIGGDEYFNCDSGRALKNAIGHFQAYQLENPDWFEKECVASEEEATNNASLLMEELIIPPVLECVPLIRDGPPVYTNEVDITENCDSVHILTPELNQQHPLQSVMELIPEVEPCYNPPYPSMLEEDFTDHMYPRFPRLESVFIVESVSNESPSARQNWPSLEEESMGQVPAEDNEEDSLLPEELSAHPDRSSVGLQNSSNSNLPDSLATNNTSYYFPPSKTSCCLPVEMEDDEVVVPSRKVPSSGSDQGYISKTSFQQESPIKEDPLMALARLQEELLEQSLGYSDMDPEQD